MRIWENCYNFVRYLCLHKIKSMKIAIIGYGKMGHIIEEIALSRGHQIVGIIDPTINVQKDNLRCTKVIDFQSEEFRSADVAIEFSTPGTAEDNIRAAWEAGVPVVSGTTGWNSAFSNQSAKVHTATLNGQAVDASALPKNWKFLGTPNRIEVKNAEGKTMLVWSSNFSVGVNIFFELNKQLAKSMAEQPQYTPSIKEIHHIHKLDKPSGTAKTLAEDIEEMYNGTKYNVQVPIESIREGEVPGTHEVTWDSEEDTIIITHIAKGRRGFGLGAVLAAERLGELKIED